MKDWWKIDERLMKDWKMDLRKNEPITHEFLANSGNPVMKNSAPRGTRHDKMWTKGGRLQEENLATGARHEEISTKGVPSWRNQHQGGFAYTFLYTQTGPSWRNQHQGGPVMKNSAPRGPRTSEDLRTHFCVHKRGHKMGSRSYFWLAVEKLKHDLRIRELQNEVWEPPPMKIFERVQNMGSIENASWEWDLLLFLRWLSGKF